MQTRGLTALTPAAVFCGLMICLAPAAGQTPSPDTKPKATSTRSERAAAQAARRKQMMERDAVLRKKRAACLQERKEKKIPILQRPQFIRDCMAR